MQSGKMKYQQIKEISRSQEEERKEREENVKNKSYWMERNPGSTNLDSLTLGSTYMIQPVYRIKRNDVFYTRDMPATLIRITSSVIKFSLRSGRFIYFTVDSNNKILFNESDPLSEVKIISTSDIVDDPQLDRLNKVSQAMLRSGFGKPAVNLLSSNFGLKSSRGPRDRDFVENELQNQQKVKLRRFKSFNIIDRDPRRNMYEVKFSRLREDVPTLAYFISPNGREFFLFLINGEFYKRYNDDKVEVIGNLTFEQYEMQQMQSEEGGSLSLRNERRDQDAERKLTRYYDFNIIYRDPHRNIYEVMFSRLQRNSTIPTQAFFILPNGREISLYLKDGEFFRIDKDEKVQVIGNLTMEDYERQQRVRRRDQEGMQYEDKISSDRRKIDRYKEILQQRSDLFEALPERDQLGSEDERDSQDYTQEELERKSFGGKSRRKRKSSKSTKTRCEKRKSKRKRYY